MSSSGVLKKSILGEVANINDDEWSSAINLLNTCEGPYSFDMQVYYMKATLLKTPQGVKREDWRHVVCAWLSKMPKDVSDKEWQKVLEDIIEISNDPVLIKKDLQSHIDINERRLNNLAKSYGKKISPRAIGTLESDLDALTTQYLETVEARKDLEEFADKRNPAYILCCLLEGLKNRGEE
ncbi:hypothetical protein COEREDRAFT_86252 [Coemansia reversa NRRL 1564]|uniref:Uncharacterized protein n=1 Tax=Coemansia reversa (strain ATCC 12441 / NRRL 1564) TaxID=763665 RepID=A0A2G5BE17_COERN|nr:hypothetical protein COEREDRAFT_86252 [Coemansia reversa NRRL 1564]|eukprot:PIA17253.1 hypothetical protein COEREDRAFT_86252 [Coemansia reversa NRRL 1564]